MGLLLGSSTGQFRPADDLTRQELAALLARALQLPLSDVRASSFADVPESGWSASYIKAVYRAGLMTGGGADSFRPQDPVTREELAAVFVRAVKGVDARGGLKTNVQDAQQVSSWATSLVDAAMRLGLIDTPDEKLNPRGVVKREHIAKFLLDIFQAGEQTKTITNVDGDVLTIDGKPFLVEGKWKQLLGERNMQALEGAVVQFKFANRTLDDLSDLEIVKDGVVLDARGTPYAGSLKISGNGVTVTGDTLGQVILAKGVSGVEVNAKIKTLTVDGEQAVQLKGNAQIGILQVTSQQARLTLGSNVEIGEVQLPKDVKLSQVIVNLNQVGGQLKHVRTGIDDRYSWIPSPDPWTPPATANHAPTVKNAIPPVNAKMKDGVHSVSLADVFADEDQDALTYTAVSSNTSIAAVAVNGAVLSIMPVSTGTAAITVTADDGKGGTAQTEFTVAVKDPNDPPQGTGIPNQTKGLGDGNLILSLNAFFTDADNDPLSYEVNVEDSSIATFILNADQLTLTPVQAGSTKVTVKASDGRGGTATQSFQLHVTAAPNRNPVVQKTPDNQTLTVGHADYILDLSALFSDPDQDMLTYEAVSLNPSLATVSVNGAQAAVHALASGTTKIRLKALDGKGGEAETEFQITINEPPVISAIPAQTLQLGDAPTILDLDSYVVDPDQDMLTFTAVSAASGIVTVSVSGQKVTLTPVAEGSTTVTITVTDGRGGTATQSFQLHVTAAPNRNPVVQKTPDNQTLTVGHADYSLDLSTLFSDPDQDMLTYEAVSLNPSLATVSVNGAQATVHALASGTTTIRLKALDGKGGEAETEFQITINEPPVISAIPAQTLQLGDAPTILDLGSYVVDPDQDTLTFTAVSAASGIATVSVSGQKVTLTPVAEGSTTVTITATDRRGGTAASTFAVTVNAAPVEQNHAPEVVSSIYEQVLTAGVTNARTFDLSQLFEDQDGDVLTFTAVPQMSDIVNATVSGDLLTLTPASTAGSTIVQITADDGKGGTAAYDLTVRNAPLAPNGRVEIRTKQGVNDSITYDLSSIFPNQSKFQLYEGTPDSTFTGPSTLNGTLWTWNSGLQGLSSCVIGADGMAAILNVAVAPQGAEDLYFSQYMDMGSGRTAIQLFHNAVGDTTSISGYELEVHQYKPNSGQKTSYTRTLLSLSKGVPYLFIDRLFTDLFAITNVTYYNDELKLYDNGNTVTTGFVLKKDGVTIDVLGDPGSNTQFMPNGGTIIRKSGIRAGSDMFSLYGEWNSFPAGTVQYLAGHTP
ncbi:Ig-like domain-containing protein [Paenibacillus sp. GCM10027626]|uniref:Ig-like domain-containing protein n=1 Tax=Paenibacillus sp. GCM10027626 TaxID=3273411 RepID=UPI003624E736